MRVRLETRCGCFRDVDWPLLDGRTPREINIPLPPPADQLVRPVPEGSFVEGLERLQVRRFIVYGHGEDPWGNRLMRYREASTRPAGFVPAPQSINQTPVEATQGQDRPQTSA